ncbi:Major Facilitator Superfamily protein [Streptomyces sp. yr375]|uniref:MFS transporter n=1 Tax=Streptomyces sp. yr375 TaxID=1761906 RepID=UPI0008CB571D|nr:MFS transporter [Streptomyces sp. yr375]SER70576.1 Major Facilitator Superfamily protein [Streptomyces sp. yr375]
MSLNVESQHTEREAGRSGFGARYALILIALLWACQLNGLIGLISGNAQSAIAIHFQTTKISWFSQVGLLGGVFATPFVVKAAAMYGKRRVMVVITSFGLVGDVLAAVATNYETLLVGRALAGFYGAAGALTYALARDVFPRRLVGPASGLLGGGVGLVALGGPFLSGWLLDDHGFRTALWFMAAATALSLVLLLVFVPESPVREERTRMDWAGGFLLGGGLTAVVYGIGEGAGWGWTSGRTLGVIGAGIVAVIAFLVVEGKVAHPMFPISLLGRRRVWTTFLATGLVSGAIYAGGVVTNLLTLMPNIPGVSGGLGWSATKAALVAAPGSILVIGGAVATGALARRFDSRLLLAVGGGLVAVGIGLTSQFHHSVAQFMAVGVFGAVGMGMVVSMIPVMIIESVEPEEQALANGAQGMVQGVVQGLLMQVAFVVLAKDGKVLNGTEFYGDDGYTNGFLLFACAVGVAALMVLLIPKGKRLDEAETGQAA